MAESLPCKASLRMGTRLLCQPNSWHFANCQEASFAVARHAALTSAPLRLAEVSPALSGWGVGVGDGERKQHLVLDVLRNTKSYNERPEEYICQPQNRN